MASHSNQSEVFLCIAWLVAAQLAALHSVPVNTERLWTHMHTHSKFSILEMRHKCQRYTKGAYSTIMPPSVLKIIFSACILLPL